MSRRPYNRTDRLGSSIKEVLAVALNRETHEDALRQVVVTDVDVTRDLSLARVYYYLMDPARQEQVTEALERASGFLRSRVGQEVRMRVTPELRFLYDESVDRGRRIEEILSGLDIPPEEEGEDEAEDA